MSLERIKENLYITNNIPATLDYLYANIKNEDRVKYYTADGYVEKYLPAGLYLLLTLNVDMHSISVSTLSRYLEPNYMVAELRHNVLTCLMNYPAMNVVIAEAEDVTKTMLNKCLNLNGVYYRYVDCNAYNTVAEIQGGLLHSEYKNLLWKSIENNIKERAIAILSLYETYKYGFLDVKDVYIERTQDGCIIVVVVISKLRPASTYDNLSSLISKIERATGACVYGVVI